MARNQKLLSVFLALLMILTIFPMSIIADALNAAIITVESVNAVPGSNVEVDINVKNNPGIVGASFTVTYDEGLTLVDSKSGEAFSALSMTTPESYNSPCNFAWDAPTLTDDDIKDGTILTLTFSVDESVSANSKLNVKLSYQKRNIINSDLNEIPVTINNGSVTIIDYKPGDVNGDGTVSLQDVTLVRRLVTNYNVTANELAADVDGDGEVTMRDVVLIRRYVIDADGYGVILVPGGSNVHTHIMTATAAKAATCTEDGNDEYWYCTACEKYFGDAEGNKIISYDDTIKKATGHNNISYDEVLATTTTKGYTAGVWCDKCETWLSGHKEIPTIEPNESNISYRHYVRRKNSNGEIEIVYDEYLAAHGINNPNPVTYVEGTGVAELIEGVTNEEGQRVSANGYSFLGWYEKPEATAKRVYSISKEETGDKVIYGVWSKEEYTITYLPDSTSSILPRVENDTYSVDKETSLSEPPEWSNLVWIGWSDENGKIVKSIPEGTTGNITLTANWMSRRSQTVPNTKYASSKPAVTIDEEAGIYAFTYEIGDIQNVPIQQIENGQDGKGFNLTKGQTHEINIEIFQQTNQGEATSVADTIANATTKSDSWTLSEDWSRSSTISEEHSNEVSEEQSQKASESFTKTGKYTLSSGIGGTEEHIDESGTSTKTTKKHDFGVSLNVGVEAGLKAGVTKNTPFKNASVEGNLGLDYKYSKETEKETHETHTDKTSSTWNVNEGFELSKTLSRTNEFAVSLSQSIKDTYGYSETLDFGGSNSNTVSSSNTSSQSREYASSVTYSTEQGKKYVVKETLTAEADTGYYRKVIAANFKVFAVVIYDMKSNTFSTMTYSLKIKNSDHLFTDYSTVSSFNDYENGVLPFEVPSFVSDYVYGLVGASEGVKVDDETGIVESYGFKDPATGICYKKYNEYTKTYSEPCDTDVIIPRYVVVTVSNNQKKIVPVTGISASAFSGSTVTSVYLSDRITELPAGTFENCTSLKYVRGGSIKTIGANAFKNCTSLFEFVLPDIVTSLGKDAFMGVDALTVNAANPDVLDAALNSGVKALTVDLATLSGTIDGKKIATPATMEYFSISGGGKTYNKVSVDSSANTVVLNNMTINNNVDVPLKLTGANLELSFVTIKAGGLIMRLDADNTYVTLDGNNYLVSSGKNAVLSKSIRFLEKEGSSAAGKLRVTGNILVYGTAYGTQRVTFASDAYNFVYLTEDEYTNVLDSHYVYFDANGGTVDSESKLIMWNSQIGELPTPTRDYYTFDGWYTAKDGGDKVTEASILDCSENITLYAHWELKPLSDWVKASEMPEDAMYVESKWNYTYTSDSQLDSSTDYSILSESSSWSDYGSWSSWSKSSVSGSDSRQVETKTVTDSSGYTQYRYWRYRQSGSTKVHWCANLGEKYWGGTWYKEYTDWQNSQMSIIEANSGKCSCCGTVNTYGSSTNPYYWEETRWIDPVTHIEYRYRDRHIIYIYNLESSANPTGQANVSDVQEWVRYRSK